QADLVGRQQRPAAQHRAVEAPEREGADREHVHAQRDFAARLLAPDLHQLRREAGRRADRGGAADRFGEDAHRARPQDGFRDCARLSTQRAPAQRDRGPATVRNAEGASNRLFGQARGFFIASSTLPAALWALPAVFWTAPLACRPTLPVTLPAASLTAPLAWLAAPSVRFLFICISVQLFEGRPKFGPQRQTRPMRTSTSTITSTRPRPPLG